MSLALTVDDGRVIVIWLFINGIGIWGINSTVVWGFAIADYVWWIGIGNAGTLISSMLLLTRQKWRASTNRFAEAMTLFAATIAGLFPIMHLGRPLYFYWLTPYPNTMTCVAAVAQRADLGFLGDPQLHPVLDHLLVRRAHSGFRDAARPRADPRQGASSTARWRSAGAAPRGTGAPTRPCISRSPASACRSWCRCTASSAWISPQA